MGTDTLFNSVDVAELYARHRGYVDERFMDELATELGHPGSRVCDVGAGTGAPADALALRGLNVVAVEPAAAMVAEGRRIHPRVRFVQADGERLPFPDASHDAAQLLYVLHHVDDPEEVLREAGRVVRRRGRVVVVSGNEECPRHRFFSAYFPSLVPDLPGAAEICTYARAAGLEILETRSTEHRVYPHTAIDDGYIAMVRGEMFASLRTLDPEAFAEGLDRLRRDEGVPIPPSEAVLVLLERPS